MLREYLQKLCKELELEMPKLHEQKYYPLRVGKELVAIKDLEPGFAFYAQICDVPSKKREELFTYLMRANFLGQGTGGSRIGIESNEKFLTLSLGLPYEMNYQRFKETAEDFVNYLIYWREEIAKFENEQSLY